MKTKIIIAFVGILALASAARAEVKLPALFSDHMILQKAEKDRFGARQHRANPSK